MTSRGMPLTRILWEGESEGCIDFSKLFKYLEGQFRLSAFSFLWRNTEGLAGDWRGTPLRIKSSAICYRRLERTLAPFQGPVPGMGPRASLYPVLLDREWVGCIATFGNQRKGSKNLSFEKKGLPFLARVLGTLIENHRLWKMLEKMDRQSALGFLSAGIIHEIRNPLTALSTLVQLLPQKKNDPAFMDSFQPLMLKELDRLELLTDQSLQFARTGTPAKGKVDLQETLERISQLIRPSLGRKRIQLRIKTEPGIKIKVNPAQLESLILNLMKNAISAVGDKGFIQVSAKRTIRGGGDNKNWICLSVKDNGKGIDAKEMGQIFDPYFTTNPEGTGLGLAICRRVVENYGGILKVSSKRGVGSAFYAYFPSTSD